ncbi:hypothetical protein Pan258_21990 [Symmachiella dynata]|uniref:hypothetical protein n=1 Tax=Symmachiella dynata TaxID=2527995 RepID=UPI00118C7BA9|nr:hypothetical protein [Symmachiella dynata]QDT48159.1 hypothetical protein Pan258_21990 [Symmachiella dynata]
MPDNRIHEIETLLNSGTGLHPGPLPSDLLVVLKEHIRLFKNAFDMLSKSMTPYEAFDVICSAGSYTDEYCAGLDMFDHLKGWICSEGITAAMLSTASCCGWPLDPLTKSIENPWWAYLELISAELCITYATNEPEEPECFTIRVSTKSSDETFVIYPEE